MTVLIAEDDPRISSAVVSGLESVGCFAKVVRDGSLVEALVAEQSFDVLLLDIMLPNKNGISVCRDLRLNNCLIPILMLTARDSVSDKVRGFEAGADDYLSKPFEFAELLARIRALVRRNAPKSQQIYKVADLVINCALKEVKRGDQQIQLTPREFSLVQLLAQNNGAVVSKSMIAQRVWFDEWTSINTIEVHLKNLRRKIDEPFEKKLIVTCYGQGYSLREEP